MNSQILTQINSFFKNKLIEFFGILLILCSIFIFTSIISYSPDDPNFIYAPENIEIKNIGGFYGSVISDFLLQSIGLVSILFVLNLFYWGFKLFVEKKISNFISKTFFTLIYIVFGTTFINISYNDSFWLIYNGNSGFIGRIISENIYSFSNLIENQYVIYCLALITIIFFILSLNLRIHDITRILFLPFALLKKILIFFKKDKNKINIEDINLNTEQKHSTENISNEKQQNV